MWLYIFIFIAVTAVYIVTSENKRFSPITLGIVFMALGVFVALGDMLGGYDRYIYGEVFDQTADFMNVGGDIKNTVLIRMYGKEYNYVALNILIGFVTSNRYIFIFIFTIIAYLLLLTSLLKYTNRSPFVIILFMGLWFFFTFTYLRQVMAVAVSWLAIQYAIERKPVPFFLIIAMAFGFHNSAIVLTPIYFVPMKKLDKLWIFGILVVCLGFGSTGLPDALFGSFGEIAGQEERVSKYYELASSQFRFAYILEAAVFLILLFHEYDKINENNKGQVMMLNMSFIFIAFLLFFVRSENGGRMTWYYMIGLFSTFSLMATRIRTISFYSIVLLVMCALLYLRILYSWGYVIGNLYPYKTFLTDGHTGAEWIWEKYEYDPNYENNHFYR